MAIPDYTETPYREGGRDPSGWDCYGCVWWVATQHFSRQWPSYAGRYQTHPLDYAELRALILGELDRYWQEIELAQARPGDLLVLRLCGRPIHVGLLIDPVRMLHCDRLIGTAIERIDGAIWRHRVESVHRHA